MDFKEMKEVGALNFAYSVRLKRPAPFYLRVIAFLRATCAAKILLGTFILFLETVHTCTTGSHLLFLRRMIL